MSHAKCICAECEALRIDAERYRWVRKAGAFDSEIGLGILSEKPEKYDAMVDCLRYSGSADDGGGGCRRGAEMNWHPTEAPLNERVMTFDKSGNCGIGRFVDHHIMGRIWQVGDYSYSTNIVAWAPLPSPPNPVGNE